MSQLKGCTMNTQNPNTSPGVERFVELARKLVSVPKKDVDKAIEEDRKKRGNKAARGVTRKKRP